MLRIGTQSIEARLKKGGWWTIADINQTKPEQIYSWTNGHTGVETSWAIGKLKQVISHGRRYTERKAIQASIVQRLIVDGGLEREHIEHLVRTRDPARLRQPGIIVRDEDGDEVIADGGHRYVTRAMIGMTWMNFHIVSSKAAEAAELDLNDEDRRKLSDMHGMLKYLNIPR